VAACAASVGAEVVMTDRWEEQEMWSAIAVAVALAALALVVMAGGARADAGDDVDDDVRERTLYVWAGDQAWARPDFLAAIDFDERSPRHGQVLRTVPLPPPGDVGLVPASMP
jgi:hypothetical protein